jgi:hypothetical protein
MTALDHVDATGDKQPRDIAGLGEGEPYAGRLHPFAQGAVDKPDRPDLRHPLSFRGAMPVLQP